MIQKRKPKKSLTDFTHKLKNALSVILIYAQLLEEHPEIDNTEKNKYLKRIREQIQRAIKIINKIENL